MTIRSLPLLLAVACATQGPTWHQDTRPIIEARCAGCHQDQGIAPFSFRTYEEVHSARETMAAAIESGAMPPWLASDTCNTYENSVDLTEEERAVLLQWLHAGAPEGNAKNAAPLPTPPAGFTPDLRFPLPSPYTPTALDDYRCQLIDPAFDHDQFVTGFVAEPDQTSIAHHAIAFLVTPDKVADFEEMDAAFEGAGWPCYGGPTAEGFGSSVDVSGLSLPELIDRFSRGEPIGDFGGFGWLGSWAPGSNGGDFPAGTGIAVHPGDRIVLQMHYNTEAGTVEDRSAIALTVADEVEREAVVMPYTNPAWVTDIPALGEPMRIPSGETSFHTTSFAAASPLFQSVRTRLQMEEDATLVVHSVAHHMHNLGQTGRQVVEHAEGAETCLVDIEAWDFHWQSRYVFEEPVLIRAEDRITLSCGFDNTAGNQPPEQGQPFAPVDVVWGEGTRDEMCLGVLYLTAE